VQQAYGYAGRAGCGLGGVPGSGTFDGTRSPHAVTLAAGGTFGYDAFGNQTLADNPGTASDRFIRYTAEQQAHEIALSSQASPTARSRFWYGSDGQRYKREDTTNGAHLKRTLYLGNVEIVQQGGTTLTRRYVAGVLVQELQGATTTNKYLFHDHLGSVVRIASPVGGLLEGMDYGPFGERRGYSDPRNLPLVPQATNRGFTGHEMLDGLDVVHMNGRIYDSRLARFLQPDPFVQEPNNPQNFNRYTYVWNNPLNATDPSGYLGITERKWTGVVITIVAWVLQQYWFQFQGWAATAYFAGAGAAAGGATTQSWSGAAWGAFSSLAFGVVGDGFGGGDFWTKAWAQKALAHGITGGVMGVLQGGKFGHGFASAGVTQAMSGTIDKVGDGKTAYAPHRIAVSAIVGGTVSAATGGKFASGAMTAAFARAFNHEAHSVCDRPVSSGERVQADITPEMQQDIVRLGQVTFAEAAGDYSVEGAMEGVAWAVRNRVESRYFPSTYEGVIAQTNQFESVNGLLWKAFENPSALTGRNQAAYQQAMRVAKLVYLGATPDPTHGSTFFVKTGFASPFFKNAVAAGKLQQTVVLGRHDFYRITKW
jgi:RHS repeat-associated protein